MPTNFKPTYTITTTIAKHLMRIEACKEKAVFLPLTPTVLSSLRETTKLLTTHYSTMIEGNRLQPNEVKNVIEHKGHFPGRERDEREVKGYYAALAQLEQYVAQNHPVTEKVIQTLHSLAMSNGRSKVKPTPYREGQNVIKDSGTGTIVYMPPESKDVSGLMRNMVSWIKENDELPIPIIAAIVHYQFATIHPYYDGNGRTARLLTTLILHLGGYDLKGLYSLEEYYAKNLLSYYHAISIGPSHNYYLGRAESDITGWIDYFCGGMAYAFEKVIAQMTKAQNKGESDYSDLMRTLEPKQRKALDLFKEHDIITSRQIGEIFGFKPRTNSALCKKWTECGFLKIVDPSNKARKYKLANKYQVLLD
ncbi:MAG: Fic family protein [Waddliaceae bacterium]|jgi:Fic family protein|nr:Fic family protein [Waddliaceae bacterium]MBT3579228.1 Fic family protein [Waddliaceae bacterium]MBT4444272.1 Fic family protein [Waddliaceae bacterium]MBT6928927.1 Fic family protein [Waddliaceae bacterium]MBT7264174.1 Fic family protein [Waddliaceae bacterium]